MTSTRRATLAACLACATMAAAGQAAGAPAPGYTTPGLTAAQLAQLPGVSYARPLMDSPPRNLIVLHLVFPPMRAGSSASNPWFCHRPSGPLTIHVTKGALRLGLEGQPARVLHAGQSLFESARSLHSTAENAGSGPAEAFAVIAVPRGAPILTAEKTCGTPASH
jgi:hypothetical protein